MTTRHAHTRALAAVYRRACENKNIAYQALQESLAPNHRKAYEYFCRWTTPEIQIAPFRLVQAFDWSPQYASSILKELADFGLLEREAVLTDSGREFRYRLAK